MEKLKYIENFEKLGFGLFVHFGLYSVVGKGEWYLHLNPNANKAEYETLIRKFFIHKNWAKELVKTAKSAGCKYITLTTRHHDGFSLYDKLNTKEILNKASIKQNVLLDRCFFCYQNDASRARSTSP